ncbi:hypothetical protein PMAYCL1PPCAC_24897, partial [Pristionchus mayeri]
MINAFNSLDASEIPSFIVSLICLSNQASNWSIELHAECLLIHPSNNQHIAEEGSRIINRDDNSLERHLLEWNKFIANKHGFVKDDSITVEVRFWISNMKGVKIVPQVNFTDPNEPCHDVALVIGGEKIYVNKGYLSLHSPVFKTIFFGDFAERNKAEVELKDVDCKEFLRMLKFLIYPSYSAITDANAANLLKLADRFQIMSIVDDIEQFLVDWS